MPLWQHLGPGCSYHPMKDWLKEMASEHVVVPSGFVSISFDNEQRLLKNWLARGNNRSAIEVLTNIVCAVHDPTCEAQLNTAYHSRHWRRSSGNELVEVFDKVKGTLTTNV